ncbi:MAG: methyltransferase domain-containing protein [Planctomycetaceae bacterium]
MNGSSVPEFTAPRPRFDAAGRRLVPEVMDQPGLDTGLHDQALSALRRINSLSRTAGSLWPAIASTARQPMAAAPRTFDPSSDEPSTGPLAGQPLSLLDVACGGGDVALRLAQRAAGEGLPLQVSGCDFNPAAIDYATRTAAAGATAAGPRFFVHDVLAQPLPPADIVTCTLFLHHLDEAQGVLLLQRLAAAARRLVLVSDLRRTRLGYWMAHLVGRVLTRSPVVRIDGPLSVAAAWSLPEVHRLAQQAGWQGYQLRRVWPERFLLSWVRS